VEDGQDIRKEIFNLFHEVGARRSKAINSSESKLALRELTKLLGSSCVDVKTDRNYALSTLASGWFGCRYAEKESWSISFCVLCKSRVARVALITVCGDFVHHAPLITDL
jgi:hypothetical protein